MCSSCLSAPPPSVLPPMSICYLSYTVPYNHVTHPACGFISGAFSNSAVTPPFLPPPLPQLVPRCGPVLSFLTYASNVCVAGPFV